MTSTEGPPALRFRTPATDNMVSRICSASKRWTGKRLYQMILRILFHSCHPELPPFGGRFWKGRSIDEYASNAIHSQRIPKPATPTAQDGLVRHHWLRNFPVREPAPDQNARATIGRPAHGRGAQLDAIRAGSPNGRKPFAVLSFVCLLSTPNSAHATGMISCSPSDKADNTPAGTRVSRLEIVATMQQWHFRKLGTQVSRPCNLLPAPATVLRSRLESQPPTPAAWISR